MLQQSILKLDIGGIPESWITPRDAVKCIAEGHVAWIMGETVATLRGGYNRMGVRSVVEVPSIIAVNGSANIYLPDVKISVTREKLFIRDRNICSYCGDVFHPRDLEAEHIMPKSRGGRYSWMNLVASCNDCNQRKKRNRTPEEAGMSLLYLPYVPSLWENMIMEGRNILADQMEFLMASVPKHSRLLRD